MYHHVELHRNLRYVNLVNSKINKICDVKVSEDRIKYQAEVQILPELADVVAADAPAFGHREHYDGYEQQNHGVGDEVVVSKLDILQVHGGQEVWNNDGHAGRRVNYEALQHSFFIRHRSPVQRITTITRISWCTRHFSQISKLWQIPKNSQILR